MDSKEPERAEGEQGSVEQAASAGQSAGQIEQFCEPCLEENQQIQAHGYCSDCQEYLCKECYRYHAKLKLTKNHILFAKEDMTQDGPSSPKVGDFDFEKDGLFGDMDPEKDGSTSPKVGDLDFEKDGSTSPKVWDLDLNSGDKITDSCPVHPEKITEYYCKMHRKVACTTCVMLDHRNCDEVKYIPDITKGIADSQSYTDLQELMGEARAKLINIRLHVCQSHTDLEKDGDRYTTGVHKYRQVLVSVIDKLVAEALAKKQAYIASMKNQLNNAHKLSKGHMEILESVSSDISARKQEGRENGLFVLMEQAVKLINECMKTIAIVERDLNVDACEFQKDLKLFNLLTSVNSMGKLVTYRYPYLCEEINIKAFSEIYSYDINASHMLHDGRLIVTDFKNKSVKLFYTNLTLQSRVVLPSIPYDIAEVSKNEVVVTMPGKAAIQFISITDKLAPGRIINTDVPCRSVAHSGDKLIVVTYKGGELVELDMYGRRTRIIMKCPPGYLEYVKVHPNNDLYVSGGRSIGRVTMNGELVGKYKDEDLEYPRGMAIHTDGSIYVCGKDSNNIHHFTADCHKIEILLNNGELVRPYSVCFDHLSGDKLYVSEEEKSKMKVFKLRV